MKDARQLLSMQHVYLKSLLKIHPELEGLELETKFKRDLECPECGEQEKGTGALFYRMVGNEDWHQAGEVFKCSLCRDAEALEAYMSISKQEQRNQIAERLMQEYLMLPEGLANAGFKNYDEINQVTANAKEKAIAYTKGFSANPENRYNLLIQGNPGTGKSHLCAAITRTLKEKGFIVGYITTGQVLTKIKSTYQKGSAKTEESILEDLKKIDCLVIDDIGSEAIGGKEDWRKGMIFELVESRNGKPTIYTSNLTESELERAVGERVNSRLYNNTQFIDLFTEDYRKKLRVV